MSTILPLERNKLARRAFVGQFSAAVLLSAQQATIDPIGPKSKFTYFQPGNYKRGFAFQCSEQGVVWLERDTGAAAQSTASAVTYAIGWLDWDNRASSGRFPLPADGHFNCVARVENGFLTHRLNRGIERYSSRGDLVEVIPSKSGKHPLAFVNGCLIQVTLANELEAVDLKRPTVARATFTGTPAFANESQPPHVLPAGTAKAVAVCPSDASFSVIDLSGAAPFRKVDVMAPEVDSARAYYQPRVQEATRLGKSFYPTVVMSAGAAPQERIVLLLTPYRLDKAMLHVVSLAGKVESRIHVRFPPRNEGYGMPVRMHLRNNGELYVLFADGGVCCFQI